MKDRIPPMANGLLLFAMLLVVLGFIIWFLLFATMDESQVAEPPMPPETAWTSGPIEPGVSVIP